jgi:hypothetical protein
MHWLIPIGLILAGIIALSALIISKLPQAKELIDKIAGVQGFIGVGLLVVGLIEAIKVVSKLDKINTLPTLVLLTIYGGIVCAVLLGFLLGMPLIAKWIPGDSPAEQKALDMQKKIMTYQTLIAVIGLVCAVLWIAKAGGNIDMKTPSDSYPPFGTFL